MEKISVRTNPAGADAGIQCEGGVRASATTPARLAIPRHAKGCELTLSMAGMKTQTIALKPNVSGKYKGALWTGIGSAVALAVLDPGFDTYASLLIAPPLVYGFGSALIDAISRRRWVHDPDEINVKLEPSP